MEKKAEFDGERAKLYEEAISDYPFARKADVGIMKRYLNPKKGEKILGFGEGNGYFSIPIANAVGEKGEYCISDPSKDQLDNLKKRVNLPQIKIELSSAESLNVPHRYYNKVWSFGAFHHCRDQTAAMKRIYDSLKKGGSTVICDVFQGSKLAKHFDSQVARYCISGHEVGFLSEEFAKTLCALVGFKESKVKIIDLPQKWVFDSEKDMGEFIYKLHAMTLLPGNKDEKINRTIAGCKKILGVSYKMGKVYLNWPMKAIIAKK